MTHIIRFIVTLLIALGTVKAFGEDVITVGLNYPATGPYRIEGIAQKRAAQMAIDEINNDGGILNHQVRLAKWDSQSNVEVTTRNVTHMIERDNAQMIFGGVSSAVAIAAGAICQSEGIPFFATLAYANEVTGTEAHRFVFRESYNAWMAAKVLASHMQAQSPSDFNRYFYITSDYVWGHSTEDALRTNSRTQDKTIHKGVLMPFPANYDATWKAIQTAKQANSDVLVLVLFGQDLVTALKLVAYLNLKDNYKIFVPSITLDIAIAAGAKAMEGVVSTTPWTWEVPYQYDYPQGKKFVENFVTRYGVYPGTSAASAYTIMYEYKAAVERAGTFTGAEVVRALEGHEYQLLKDKQIWRDFDHQSEQTVYLVRGRFREQAVDGRGQEYFEILNNVPGTGLVKTRAEWEADRRAAGKDSKLEPLPKPAIK